MKFGKLVKDVLEAKFPSVNKPAVSADDGDDTAWRYDMYLLAVRLEKDLTRVEILPTSGSVTVTVKSGITVGASVVASRKDQKLSLYDTQRNFSWAPEFDRLKTYDGLLEMIKEWLKL